MFAPLIDDGADLPFLLTTPYWKTQDWDVSDYALPENFVDKLVNPGVNKPIAILAHSLE